MSNNTLNLTDNQNKFNIKNNNNTIKIQLMFLIEFKLVKCIFDSVQMCVDSVDIFQHILNSPQICINIAESWGISGWGWLPATCSWGNEMSSCSCSCSSSGLPSCHTPLTSKILIFFMIFSQRSYSTLTWLMTFPSSSCHITTWDVWYMEETYHCHDILSYVAWYNEAN